jgi:hypothetical protein
MTVCSFSNTIRYLQKPFIFPFYNQLVKEVSKMACEDLKRRMEAACADNPHSEECIELRREYESCMIREKLIERASRVLSMLSASLAAQEAMEFIDCMRKGGSFEECHGFYKAAPFPSPGCPMFRALLSELPEKERQQALLFIKQELLERVKAIDKELGKF